MDAPRLYAFATFAIVAAITPGPSNAMLTAAGALGGLRRGLPCLLGVAAGMGLMMLVVGFGLGALMLQFPPLLAALKWCGVAFLFWLSWKIATASAAEDSRPVRPVGFLGAAAFQWLNPKSWLVATSGAATYVQAGEWSIAAQSLLLAGIFAALTLPCGFAWLGFGAALRRALRSPLVARRFNVAMGLLLASSVAFLL